jgi:DNA-directed RNA polymerase alpha subunit
VCSIVPLVEKVPFDSSEPISTVVVSLVHCNLLEQHGIHTLQDILDRTRDDLLSIVNLGEKTVDEILERVEMKKQGIDLGELRGRTDPSEEEIEFHKQKIQEDWSDEERNKKYVGPKYETWTPPVYNVRS